MLCSALFMIIDVKFSLIYQLCSDGVRITDNKTSVLISSFSSGPAFVCLVHLFMNNVLYEQLGGLICFLRQIWV